MKSTRAVVRRLRVGVVPGWAIEHLTVGYGRLKVDLVSRLEALENGSAVPPLFVKGEWGSGKTHFLEYARGVALGRGLAVARVTLNGWTAPLNHPQRLLPLIANDVTRGDHRGMRAVLTMLMSNAGSRGQLSAFVDRGRAGDLNWSIQRLLHRFAEDTLDIGSEPCWRLFYGADLSWADYPYKRRQALDRIGFLAALFNSLTPRGLVLLFDEAETIDQLWNIRSRLGAYAVLHELAEMPGVLCIFGVTERFKATIEEDLAREVLQDDAIVAPAKAFLRAWKRGEMETITPPVVDRRNAHHLAHRIEEVYSHAYPDTAGAEIRSSCVEEWCANPSRNPRRLIRLLVHRLDAVRSAPISLA